MSSPNSNAVQSVNEEPKTSNSLGSNNSSENPFALKRRVFNNSHGDNSCAGDRMPSDENIESSVNGSIENSKPESSDKVSSVTSNKDVDVSSSDAVATHSNDVVSSSDNTEMGADSTANQPDSTTYQQIGNASSSQLRTACRYAEKCYRRNDTHREIFAHPGDPDYRATTSLPANQHLFSIVPNDNAPECRYGQMCYRKNPQHFRDRKHTQLGIAGRPKRKRTRLNSPTSSSADLTSDSEEEPDFSGDDDEDYVPPDSD